jgi:formylglycine-generating enzyme
MRSMTYPHGAVRRGAPVTASVLSLCLSLCLACTDEPGAEADETDEEEESGTENDEPVFFPPGTTLIPEGDVWRGCLESDAECDDDELPGGFVHVSSFFIDRFEVTTEQYNECVDDDVCINTMNDPDCNLSAGRFDHPINCVTYDMAASYCGWRGLRLPTEAEWERAARGDELLLYPWGDQAPDCSLAAVDECGSSTVPVGSKRNGDSPFAVADMSGNVSEWVLDFYDDDYYAASAGEDDPKGPTDGMTRSVKGSAFTVPSAFPAQRISKRNAVAPGTVLRIYGIRCARDR